MQYGKVISDGNVSFEKVEHDVLHSKLDIQSVTFQPEDYYYYVTFIAEGMQCLL